MANTTTTKTVILEIEIDDNGAVKSLGQVSDEVEKLGDKTQKTTKETANYSSAMGALNDQLGGIPGKASAALSGVKGLTGGFKSLRLAIIGTGIGALVLSLVALVTYFNRTREGSEKLNKILGFLGAGVDTLMDLVGDFGEIIFNAFSDPKQAVEDLAGVIKDNLVNRFTGLLNLIPSLAKAFDQLLAGDFSKAAVTATNAVGQIVLGVEDTVGAIDKGTQALVQFGQQAAANAQAGADLADRENKLSRDRLAFVTQEAKLQTAISEAKLASEDAEKSSTEQLAANAEAQKLIRQLSEERRALLQEELAIAEEKALLADSETDTEEAIEALKRDIILLDKESADQLKEVIGRQKSITGEIKAQTKAKQDQAAADKKASEEELQKFRDAEAAFDAEIQKRNDAAIKTQEDIAANRAIADAKEITDLQDQLTRLTELRTEQYQKDLEEKGLTLEEKKALEVKYQDDILQLTKDTNKAIAADSKATADQQAADQQALTNLRLQAAGIYVDAAFTAAEAAFGQSKALAIAQAVVQAGLVVLSAALTPPFIPLGLATSIAAGAQAAATIAGMQASTPSGGPPKPKFARGGMLWGRTHAQGGIHIEAEHGEGIINARSMSNPLLRSLASQINEIGGGVPFMARGGQVGQTATDTILQDLLGQVGDQPLAQAVLVVEDYQAVDNRVRVTESISTL